MEKRWSLVFLSIAALAWWAGQTLLPDMGLTWPDRLAAVARHPDRQTAGAALLLVAGWALVLAAVSLAWSWRTPGSPRLIRLGIAGLGLGGVWLAAGRGAFSMHLLQASRDEVEKADAVTVLEASQGLAFLALLPMLPALLVGPVLLAIGLRRAGRCGWMPLACWVLGIGTFVASEFTLKAGESAGTALAGVALVLLGRAATRQGTVGAATSEEQHEAPATTS
jgi:hypothetical protein